MKGILMQDILDIMSAMPETQKNDDKLFAELVRVRVERFPQYADKLSAVVEVFENAPKYGLPNYSSVARERLEIQKRHPPLQDKNTVHMRNELKEQYRSRYSKSRKADI